MKVNKLWLSWLLSITGSLLLVFIGWEYNRANISWLAFPILIFSFRSIRKWQHTLLLIPLIMGVKFFCVNEGWNMGIWNQFILSAIMLIPIIAALYLDRALYKHLNPLMSTFLFPTTYIVFNYLLSYTNVGFNFSLGQAIRIASISDFRSKIFLIIIFAGFMYMIIEGIKNIIVKKLAPKIFQFQRMR